MSAGPSQAWLRHHASQTVISAAQQTATATSPMVDDDISRAGPSTHGDESAVTNPSLLSTTQTFSPVTTSPAAAPAPAGQTLSPISKFSNAGVWNVSGSLVQGDNSRLVIMSPTSPGPGKQSHAS